MSIESLPGQTHSAQEPPRKSRAFLRAGMTIALLMVVTILRGACRDETILSRNYSFPAKWPMPPLTEEQIDEVKQCDVDTLMAERYPYTLTMENISAAYRPQSACDWAVLASAYSEHIYYIESLPEPAEQAFSTAVGSNPGFVFIPPIFHGYFGKFSLVEAPFIDAELSAMQIRYYYDNFGLGLESFTYTVDITAVTTDPQASVSATPGALGFLVDETSLVGMDVDQDILQALVTSLADFLPVQSQFTLHPCYDNNPYWIVSLEFDNGTVLDLTTNGSNFLHAGGPWQTEIDGQNYVQFSSAFLQALIDVVYELELPLGQPIATACVSDSIFDKAFPSPSIAASAAQFPHPRNSYEELAYGFSTSDCLAERQLLPYPCGIVPGRTISGEMQKLLSGDPWIYSESSCWYGYEVPVDLPIAVECWNYPYLMAYVDDQDIIIGIEVEVEEQLTLGQTVEALGSPELVYLAVSEGIGTDQDAKSLQIDVVFFLWPEQGIYVYTWLDWPDSMRALRIIEVGEPLPSEFPIAAAVFYDPSVTVNWDRYIGVWRQQRLGLRYSIRSVEWPGIVR